MIETMKNYSKVEKLMYIISENQKFAGQKDKLTVLIDKYSEYLSEELSERELEYVAAAKMPEIPKYKLMKNL